MSITGRGLAQPLVLSGSLNELGRFVIPFPARALENALARGMPRATLGDTAGFYHVLVAFSGDGNFIAPDAAYRIAVVYNPHASLPHGHSVPAGQALLLGMRVFDGAGVNLSASVLPVQIVLLVAPDGYHYGPTRVKQLLGQNLFVYHPERRGYLFNLSTIRLKPGHYVLGYRVGRDPTLYKLTFKVV
jgi:hypothetical protein